jgi:hypothetical protein
MTRLQERQGLLSPGPARRPPDPLTCVCGSMCHSARPGAVGSRRVWHPPCLTPTWSLPEQPLWLRPAARADGSVGLHRRCSATSPASTSLPSTLSLGLGPTKAVRIGSAIQENRSPRHRKDQLVQERVGPEGQVGQPGGTWTSGGPRPVLEQFLRRPPGRRRKSLGQLYAMLGSTRGQLDQDV